MLEIGLVQLRKTNMKLFVQPYKKFRYASKVCKHQDVK